MKILSPVLHSRLAAASFGSAFAGVSQDTKNLPSGSVLYTGAAARLRAADIARKAWKPDITLRGNGDYTHYQDLEAVLNDPANTLLGVYDDIIIYADKKDLAKDSDGSVLRRNIVAIIEHGRSFPKQGQTLYNASVSSPFPLAVKASENPYSPFNYLAPAEERNKKQKTYHANFDQMVFNPMRTFKRRSDGQLQPPWLNFFHELAHRAEVHLARTTYFKAGSESDKTVYPFGHAFSEGGQTYLMDDKIGDDMLPGSNMFADTEDRSTQAERRLAAEAGLSARQSYVDTAVTTYADDGQSTTYTYYLVTDPIKPLTAEKLQWIACTNDPDCLHW